jgi:dihydroorotase-like cyclic amidohydrolase
MTHCENEEICQALEAEMGDDAYQSFTNFANTRPTVSEVEAISRALMFAKDAGCPIYIVHCSSKEGLEKIKEMRAECSTPIYAEVTVPNLTLTVQNCEQEISWILGKTTPPPRDQESVDALWEGIRKGEVDCVGTDHSAIIPERKEDFRTGDPGFSSIEIYPALILTEAIRRHIPLQTVARVCTYNPAKIFGLLPQKGTLKPGADGDVSIFNLNVNTVLDSKKTQMKYKLSPLDGWKLTAQPEATFLRGELIFRHGKPVITGKGKALLNRRMQSET